MEFEAKMAEHFLAAFMQEEEGDERATLLAISSQCYNVWLQDDLAEGDLKQYQYDPNRRITCFVEPPEADFGL